MGSGSKRQDALSFFLVTAFAVVLYAVPGEWLSWAQPLRLALVTSGLAALFMVARRVGRMEPIFLDGVRGVSLICFIGLCFASVGWAINPEVARSESLDFIKCVAIYLTMVNVISTPRRLYIFTAAMVLASMVTSVGAINWYHHGVDLSEGFRGRWVGVYADPNHMAMALALIVPLAVAFVARKQTPMLLRILCGAAGGLAVGGIVVSHSRGGFLGLCLGMAFWAFREKRRIQAFALGGLLAVGMAIWAPKSFWERNETVTSFHEDASALGRVYAWHVASAISVDKPLLGVGIGGFRYAWPLYAPSESHRSYVAHNVYLDVIGELGFVGLFFFLIFTGGAAAGAFETSRDPEVGWLARAIGGAIAGYLICDMFSGYLLSSHFYVLFALAATCQRVARMPARSAALQPATLETALAPASLARI